MGKRLLAAFLAFFVLVGLCSHVEARPCPEKEKKSFLQQGNEDLAVIKAIGKIDDPDKRVAALNDFLDRVKPALERAVKNGLERFACKISKPGEEGKWLVILQDKAHGVTSEYFMLGENPPENTIIIQVK